MSDVNAGKHSIMLEVELSRELEEVAQKWVAGSVTRSRPKQKPHVTALFLGPEFPVDFADVMLRTAIGLLPKFPAVMTTTGDFRMFGKGDHFVATCQSSVVLNRAREELIDLLSAAYPEVDVKSRLNSKYATGVPHVTLGVTTRRERQPIMRLRRYDLPVVGVIVKAGDIVKTSRAS